ncbi:MAG: Fic/DOC family protein [Candidatus Sumerlaeaceae bacterium]
MPAKRSRYDVPENSQTQFQPGSNDQVLLNLLGITSAVVMDRLEARSLLEAQEYFLTNVITEDTRFTAELLCSMHRHWLGRIYPWAGQYRMVNLSKDNFQWPPYGNVPKGMRALEEGLLRQHTPCTSAPVPELARRLAEVHAELLLVHPFREGNGRIARWLIDLMALQAGYPLMVYRFSGPRMKQFKAEYIHAVRLGYAMDFEALAAFFETRLEDALRTTRRAAEFPGRRKPRAPSTTEDS